MSTTGQSDCAVAVIMAFYRKDPLDQFDQAMASIEGQEFDRPIRIYLCVDGPLPDSHESWLQTNEHRFYKVLRNPENIGLARSLNRLIDALEDEEFVFRMDGDDISLPTRFARQIEMMQAEPDLGLIGSQAQDIDNDNVIIAERRYLTTPDGVRNMLTRANPVLHPAYCMRRDILRDPELRYPDAFLSEDLGFLVLLVRKGIKISNHPDTLVQWRTDRNFFARRRSLKRGWTELKIYLAAVRDAHGLFSPQVAYPFARFAMRVMPSRITRLFYNSNLRNRAMDRLG